MEIKLSQIWYYMIYLSHNDTISFFGWLDMQINTSSYIIIYFLVVAIVIFLTISILNLFNIKKVNGFFVGTMLSFFVFFNVIVKQCTDLTQHCTEDARALLTSDAKAFNGYQDWEKRTFKINNEDKQ